MRGKIFTPAVRITTIYLLFSILCTIVWNSFSHGFFPGDQKLHGFLPYLAILFILITSLLFFLIVRKELAKKSKNNEYLYKLMFENANDALFILDKGNILECNDKTCDIFNAKKEEIINNSLVKLSPEYQNSSELSSSKIENYINQAMSGESFHLEWQFVKCTGEQFYTEISLTPLPLSDKVLLLAVIRDISENKMNQLKLIENQLFIKRITEQSPDIIYIFDIKQNKNIYTNKDIGKLLGYEEDEIELSGTTLFEKYIHPDDLKLFSDFESFIKDWNKEYVYKYQYRIKAKDGEWHWFSGKEKEFQRENGKISTVIGTVRDITDIKKKEEAILNSENKFYQIFNNNQNLMFIVDLDLEQRIDINKTYELITGYSKKDVLGNSLRDNNIIKGGDKEKYYRLLSLLKEKREFSNEELIIQTKTGEEKTLLIAGQLLEIENKSLALIEAKDITEQKKAQNALIESEKKFRDIFNTSSDGIILAETNYTIIELNEALEKMLGYRRNDIINTKLYSYILPQYLPLLETHLQKLINKENIYTEEIYIFHAMGHAIAVEVNVKNITLNNQMSLLITVRDITERKKAEKEIKESEEKYRILFEKSKDPTLLIHNNKFIDCNSATVDILKLKSKEEIYNVHPSILSPYYQPDGQKSEQKADEMMQQAHKNGYHRFEWEHIDSKGNIFPVEVSLTVIFIKGEEMIYTVWRDVAERKKAEKALIISEQRLSAIVNNAFDAMYISDLNGRLKDINQISCKMLGYNRKELLSMTIMQIDASFPTLESCKAIWNKIEANSSQTVEGKHIKKSGEIIPVEITTGKFVLEGNEMIIGFARDISERKKHEQAIKDNEIKYRSIFENISDAIAIVDKSGKFISVNPAFYEMHNFSDKIIDNLTFKDILDSVDKSVFDDFIESISNDGKYENEAIEQLIDGTQIYIHIKGTRINLNNQNYFLAVISDITEKKDLERKMMTAIVKTEERERTRIAKDLHDGLGPILSTIKLYNQWSQDPKTKTSKEFLYQKSSETIDESIRTLKEISANLSPHILANFGLVEALNTFIERINITNEWRIDFKSNLNSRIDTTIESTIYRILTECINNTIKYARANDIQIQLNHQENKLFAMYSDNGIGFDFKEELNAPKGLGISNILNRINTVGGSIEINSSINVGTEIKFEIPL